MWHGAEDVYEHDHERPQMFMESLGGERGGGYMQTVVGPVRGYIFNMWNLKDLPEKVLF